MIAREMMPELDCDKCTPDMRLARGCTAIRLIEGNKTEWRNRATVPTEIMGELRWDCAAKIWEEDPHLMSFLYNGYAHYRNGFLLEEGGVLAQPHVTMQLIALLADQIGKCEAEKDDQTRRKRAAQARANELVGKATGSKARPPR